MAQVDTVTQRKFSSAEELFRRRRKLAAQSEHLQQLMTFFRVAGERFGPRGGEEPTAPDLPEAHIRSDPRSPATPTNNDKVTEEANFSPF